MNYIFYLIYFLLIINNCLCFNYSVLNNLLQNKNNIKINRRNTLLLLPPVLYPLSVNAENEKSIEE